MFVIPATPEAEAGGLQLQDQSQEFIKALSKVAKGDPLSKKVQNFILKRLEK